MTVSYPPVSERLRRRMRLLHELRVLNYHIPGLGMG